MKAVRLYSPGDLRVEEVEKPKVKEDEALIKVKAVGICGSDIPRVNKYGAHISPITIGHEFSGEIVELGTKVDKFSIGTRVTVAPLIPCYKCKWCKQGLYSLCEDYSYIGSRQEGAMAEYVAVPSANLIELPANVSFETGATTDPAANAVHALWKGLKKGDTIAILGVGPIGLFAVQFAKRMGAKKIIAVDLFQKKLDIALKIGATDIVNAAESDTVKAIMDLTDNYGVEYILETAGSKFTQNQALHIAAPTANIIYLGISHDELNYDKQSVENLLRGELNIKGSWNSFSDPFPGKEWYESLMAFEKGDVVAEPIISHKLPLAEAPRIFNEIKNNKNFFFNKIIFLPELD